MNAALEPIGPNQDTLDTSRIGGDDANRGKDDSGACHIGIHRVEPIVSDLAGARTHVGRNHGWTIVEMIDERIEAGRCMDVQFRDVSAEEMRERASGFVLGIEIE